MNKDRTAPAEVLDNFPTHEVFEAIDDLVNVHAIQESVRRKALLTIGDALTLAAAGLQGNRYEDLAMEAGTLASDFEAHSRSFLEGTDPLWTTGIISHLCQFLQDLNRERE